MLLELAVSQLGVIDELSLVLPPGMIALTGETGAGKTLVVTAIDLLMGGRADSSLVAPGAREATVEARFVVGDDELVLRRVVPADGRSRAYVDGRLATVAELAERGARLVDLHGQHTHQSLLGTAVQREALDRFAAIDLGPLLAARAARRAADEELVALGGDDRALARELDLLDYQIEELETAGLRSGELDELEAEEALLADAVEHRHRAEEAALVLGADEGAAATVAGAAASLTGRAPFADVEVRLAALVTELTDVARTLRTTAEAITEDPDRLQAVRDRIQRVHELRRKYGASVEEVLAFLDEARQRRSELVGRGERVAHLTAERARLDDEVRVRAAEVGAARRVAAPSLAAAATGHLPGLALPSATLAVTVGDDDPGDDVAVLFTANPGSPPAPLRKVASGGELARVMLALRLVLTAGPPTLVFDEVDAGIGGSAAVAVGRSLSALAPQHQVLVVTHLPQVAAYADHQVLVEKAVVAGTTRTTARVIDDADRVVELSRMLAGQPDSDAARRHAAELLATAARDRTP